MYSYFQINGDPFRGLIFDSPHGDVSHRTSVNSSKKQLTNISETFNLMLPGIGALVVTSTQNHKIIPI